MCNFLLKDDSLIDRVTDQATVARPDLRLDTNHFI